MPVPIIDTHCHLHDRQLFDPEQANRFIRFARVLHVEQIICIGTSPEDSLKARDFAAAHPGVFWTYGIHPEYASRYQDDLVSTDLVNFAFEGGKDTIPLLKRPASERDEPRPIPEPPVAIGEVGLDYHYDGYDRAAQIRLFERMLQLATNLHLPVSLHIREAFDDAWGVLDNFPNIRGVVHSFTGSKRDLRQALDRNFYIGVNGLVTYTTTPLPPLDKILLETDAPFLTPAPYRGTINKPEYVRLIADYLSATLGVAEDLIAEQTTKNGKQLFQI